MNWLHVILGLLMMAAVLAGAGWWLWRALKASDDPLRLLFHVILTAGVLAGGFWGIGRVAGDGSTEGQIGGVLLGCVLGLVVGILWAPRLGAVVGDWLGNLYTGGSEPAPAAPAYSIAEAHWKFGRYAEAEREIRGQLAAFPRDVQGHLLLARLQAEPLSDLHGARATLEGLAAQPGLPPGHLAAALNLLADLQLKVAGDTAAAQAALAQLEALLPGTDHAFLAAQRRAHLTQPGAVESVRQRGPIPLPRAPADLGLRREPVILPTPDETPGEELARLVRQLEAHPLDIEARERLAVLYGGEFGRLDLATDQFEQLLAVPNAPPRKAARWLNLLADAQVRGGADLDTVRATLQRIIDRFPGLAPAEVARQRMASLALELKGREQGRSVKMGTYERDLGLKRRPPARPRDETGA
ncbi:MAG: hypothetical protein RJA22_531 [Verrucomicrobiota bacterium]|jgi:tetratricopeptide (TPR) repeat protein